MIKISLTTINKAKTKITKILLFFVFTLLFVSSATSQTQTISLAFSNGFLGTQGNNSNSTTGNKTFSELGISRVSFSQIDVNGDGLFGDGGGSQGNDLAGTVKFYFTSGQTLSLNGALNFRNSGNTRDIIGFIFDQGQNTSFIYGANLTYNIVTGNTASTSTSLGLRSYSSTYTIGTTFGGNAATSGLLDALNDELRLTPQPSTVTLTNNSVTEGQNLVYNVTLTSATAANNPQIYTFSKAGTSSSTVDYNATFTFSNGVINNGDGTITVPGGVSSFSITVATIDDAPIESTETLILNIGSKSATGNILDNDAIPAITSIGTLKTFTSCNGCTVAPQSFSISGQYLTANLVVTAPTGVQVSTNASSGFASTISITPSSGTVTTTTIYAKLTSNATSTNSGVISVTSTGATSKTVTVTTNTDNALNFIGDGKKVLTGNTIFTDGQQNLTIEFWMKPTDATVVFRGIIGAQTTNSDRSPSFWQYGRKIHFDLYEQNNTTSYGGFTEEVLKIGEWNHVAMIKNGTTLKFIVNGSPVAIDGLNGATSKTVPANIKAVNNYQIGALDNFFTGSLDEIRFWSTARTETNINDNMFSELTGSETGLLSYISFNNGTISGNTSGITLNALGSINLSLTTSATIDIVAGFIPSIKATGNATTLATGNTLQLSNGLSGGTWASSNTGLATVNTSTGLVTGVASGSVNITYTICSKTVSYALSVITPTITTSGTLKTFTTCSGCSVTPQSFTVSGSNLGTNITVTAPSGFEVSTTIGGTYSSTLTLTQSSGTVASTPVYVRLTNNATTNNSGTINITSIGATTRTVSVVTNTDNALMFDGVDDYVSLGDVLDVTSLPYTTEAWVYWKGSTFPFTEIFTKDVVQAVAITSNNELHANFGNGSSWSSGLNSTTRIPLNKWTHVAVTRSSTGLVKMYINGVLDASSNTMNVVGDNGAIRAIGAKPLSNGVEGEFNGAIDDLKVWNSERSAADIAGGMYTELAGNETNLLAYYNFNQGTAGGTNSGISTLTGSTSTPYNGTLSGFTLTGTTSNFVAGFIPAIAAAGNATTINAGGTLALSNSLTGGVWSSSNTNFATVNSSSGLVTAVAGGSVTINYTICNKTVSYNLTVLVPTLTVSSLKTFTSCSGCTITPQTLNVSGSNLGANVVVTAPAGFEISTLIGGTYSSTITLSPSSGTLGATSIYVRLINSTTTATSGNITVVSTGAVSKTVIATVNTDNALNFDGVNDAINIGQPLSSGNSFTMEAWINYKGSMNENNIISSSSNVFWIYQDKLNAGIANSFQLVTSPNVLEKNKWYHVALTFDDPANLMKLYIDGNLVASASTSLSYTGGQNVYIGSHYVSSPISFFKGNIDEVRIWSTARSSTDIANYMNTELSGNESGLVSYYNFNQGIINGTNTGITTLTDSKARLNGSLSSFTLTGTNSNFVPGFIPSITGTATSNVGASLTLSNTLTGGTWSSSNTAIATVNSATGVVTGVAVGTSTITYTICEKIVTTSFTVTVPTITTTGTLTAFNTCATTNSAAQTFTISAQYLTSDLVLTAPTGYEIATSYGGTYSSTISITPTSGSVAARLIYVRTTTSIVNGQSGNITITSTGATTKNVATGNAVVTQNKTASVSISSNASNNTICNGASITFTATPTNGGLTPTYQWYLNGASISGATSSTYTTSALSSNATITVVMGSSIASCLSGSPATSNAINVTVNNVPNNPGAISGLTTICMNSNQVYSVTAVTGATSYTWVVTGSLSASATSTSNVINITAANAAGTGTISVYANNACGTSLGGSTLSVNVNNTPAPTASFTVSANTICLTSPVVTFTSTSTPNATTSSTINSYSWNFGDGNTATTATANNTFTSSGTFDAILTIQDGNVCTSSISSRITVDPISVSGTASAASATICEGSNTTLTLTGSVGTIQWQSSTDGINFTNISGATASIYTTSNLTTTTYYQAVVTSGSCSSASSGVITVTVSPTPNATISNITGLYNNTTSFDLAYSNVVGSPNEYSISTLSPNAMPNFVSIANYGLLGSPITVTIPASASGTYNFNLVLGNNTLGCTSANIPFTVSIAVQAPASLSYTSPNVYPVGSAITSLNPTSSGGPITTYSIGPSLPAGLTIDPNTGIISGTPSAVSTQTSYTVTGTNASGTVTATVVITVNVAPPASLSYTTPNVYPVGSAITSLNPTSTGGPITTYSIGPSLPAGLTIDPNTGIISGTPSAVSTQTSYTVTGTNASGTITATVVITVNVAPPASLSYTTPNVYTVGTVITPLSPTSTGGPITTYSIGPSLPAGLTIDPNTGVISGTPNAASAQTTYIVTGTNASGSVTATVVITVNSGIAPQPQGSLNAVDYGLLATDTVKLKLTTSNGVAPFTLILSNNKTTAKDTISNLTPVNNVVTFLQKRLDTTKVFTIFKLIDANNNTRSSGFTKDTTIVNVLKPKILLTLKAEPTIKQADNSFKTRLLLKVKNSGDLDLRNVQVNANLSSVFPVGINYVLDSVRVIAGNFALNPNYTGAGTATSASSTYFTATASSNGSKQSLATLDQNYLFNNGVSLNKDEEGEIVYYVSIGATTQNVTLKLQFETAGDGVLVKNDGTSSAQETTSKSDDGTNIAQHPDVTNQGLPMPTYVPLFPNEKIGGSLAVSSATAVTGGYQYHFIAKIKNYGNVNLDSIRIQYNFNNMYPAPDQASLIGMPTITRGNIVYNTNVYDGYNDVNLFKYGGDLQVGDSATYEYDLKVTTNKTAYTWPNYFVVYGRSINSGVFINDTSMSGTNPDPNNDNDPAEQFFTKVTINFTPPAPPTVENKTYVYGTTKPANIGGLVKSTPAGTIPVWCDQKTAACSIIPPATPTEIGKYIYALRSYDTTTLLYSEVLVYDTVIIKPPVPIVMNKKYIIGNTSNPANVSNQVTGMSGSVLSYFKNATLQSVIPALGTVPGVTRYTTSQTVNGIDSDTVGFTVTMLDPKTMLHLRKIADEPKLQSNSTFNITYTFIVTNRTDEGMTNVLVADNLQNTFPSPTLFDVVSVSSTGGLVFNNAFNGKTDVQLLKATSSLAAAAIDTIRLTVNLQPKGYSGTVNNVAVITATTPYGNLSINSSSTSFANETVKSPTPAVIPDLAIDIPEAFSPNRDGVNDRFVILKPFGTTLELEVYNRWGNVVYYNANYNNEWDGRGTNNFIGQDLMDGGYYYTLKAKSVTGNSQIFKGFVLIQR